MKIQAQVVGHSLSPQGEELISILGVFPRIVLAEVNTHRMLSKNTASSRAIPFKKMVEAIEKHPFIPYAWQKHHPGMQGTEYLTDKIDIESVEKAYLRGRDEVVARAQILNTSGITKQIVNRGLEPYMWTTMLITGSRQGWENFFNLRCPRYEDRAGNQFRSRRAFNMGANDSEYDDYSDWTLLDWLKINKSGAEIHISLFAEAVWDAVNASKPNQLKAGDWHIPFENKIFEMVGEGLADDEVLFTPEYDIIKMSVALAARTSYTVIGDDKDNTPEGLIALHDTLLAQDPPHSSPLEHVARAMSNSEYTSFVKGELSDRINIDPKYDILEEYKGWCNNLKGFIPYRYMVDNKWDIENVVF